MMFATRTGSHIPQRVLNRFWERVGLTGPDSCWPWQLSCGSHGYGQVSWRIGGGKIDTELTHRVAWVKENGFIPEGMTVDHECHNKVCCNPAHLRLKTNVDNATDNGQSSKTHCPQGHPYAGVNLYTYPNGHRACRACHRENQQRQKAKRKFDGKETP